MRLSIQNLAHIKSVQEKWVPKVIHPRAWLTSGRPSFSDSRRTESLVIKVARSISPSFDVLISKRFFRPGEKLAAHLYSMLIA